MRIRLLILILAPQIFLGACGGQSEVRTLRKMPTLTEAVVAPSCGRLFPSATGSGHGIKIPDEVFALSPVLAEVLAGQAPEDTAVVATIAPGDQVQILVADEDPQGLILVRTQSETYCWVSSADLTLKGRPDSQGSRTAGINTGSPERLSTTEANAK